MIATVKLMTTMTNDTTFQDAIQVEDVIDDSKENNAAIYGETINNNFIVPVGTEDRATGVTTKYEGVLYAQYCHYGELYYQSCKNDGDDPVKTEEAIDMLTNYNELWSLCDNAPPLQVSPMLSLRSEMEYDQ